MSFLVRYRPATVANVYHSNLNQCRIFKRFVYEQTRSGSMQFEKKKYEKFNNVNEIEKIKQGAKIFKNELRWSWKSFLDLTIYQFRSDNKCYSFEDQEIVKIWDFDRRNVDKVSSFELKYKVDKYDDMKNWTVTCDSDYDIGFSKCSWTVSPSGHALFSGYLNNNVPKDGNVIRSGYAFLSSNKSRGPFFIDANNPAFHDFTHIVMRIRGDGRQYFIILNTSDVLDITWFDSYQFILYTHGGPYWQYVKIPLSRFFFQYQANIQDRQCSFNPVNIKSVGILAYDTFSGAFNLEIDYIGFMCDSQWNDNIEYESYYHESATLKVG